MKRKALFLDRDGVINIDYGYVHSPDKTVFVDGIFELVRHANAAGYAVVVVTNQAGIARGYFSELQFQDFTRWMVDAFREKGAVIDRVYHCPHHPEAGIGELKLACDCRKPEPGMLLQAQRDLDLDMAGSMIIGDKLSDLEAGRGAGVPQRFLFSTDPEAGQADNTKNISSLLDVLPLMSPLVSSPISPRLPSIRRSA